MFPRMVKVLGCRVGRTMHAPPWRKAGGAQPMIQPSQSRLRPCPRQSSPSHNRAWAYLVGQAIALCGTLLMLFTGDAM